MIVSMTGYGQAIAEANGKAVRVEIKSLNSRATEVRCKLPNLYRDREMDLRKQVIEGLQRGKIEISITIEGDQNDTGTFIDKSVFIKYYQEIVLIADELQIDKGDIVQSVLRIPNVIGQDDALASDEEWSVVNKCVREAIEEIKKFRSEEGRVLGDDMRERINMIEENLKAVEPHESNRLQRVKDRLRKSMEEYISNQVVDQNRFEQEIIYYIEKMDINEEKVRLGQHCIYFVEEMNTREEQIGRKLAFIAQEIGREINTIGAKAQHADIQQHVVIMKDELEKLKEQLANIL